MTVRDGFGQCFWFNFFARNNCLDISFHEPHLYTVAAVNDHEEYKKQDLTFVHVYITKALVCFDIEPRVRGGFK